ncbi:MAG: hypothetical protein EAZ61_06680 [Oscillatoriales cyanobacterium]|nr:MAG: hypothetical protein EAZ61_06680 [Oscillatoriales cyanobacterium]
MNFMKNRFYILDENEVINLPQSCQPTVKNPTCTSGEFLHGLQVALKTLSQHSNLGIRITFNPGATPKWFSGEGIEGEALRFGSQNWQMGKLKLAIVFCPDDEEEEIAETISNEIPLLEASLEPIQTSSEPLDEIRKLADET